MAEGRLSEHLSTSLRCDAQLLSYIFEKEYNINLTDVSLHLGFPNYLTKTSQKHNITHKTTF